MKTKFRLPNEVKKNEKRVPVSARIPETMDKEFGKIAKKNGISKAKLIESVLEDYLHYIQTHGDYKK